MKAKLLLIVPLLLMFFVTSCNQDSMEMDDQFKRENNFNKPGDQTIYDLAAATPALSTLVEAIVYVDSELGAGLADAIQSNEVQLTVFAPTNDAFGRLLEALEVSSLDEVPATTVLAVLQYHLVEGRRGSNSVVPRTDNMKTIETLLEGATFDVDKNAVIYATSGNSAQIGAGLGAAYFNISASNGIVHVIDEVILP